MRFGTWAAYAAPVCLMCCWVVLCLLFIGPKKTFSSQGASKSCAAATQTILEDEKRSLELNQWAEGSCMTILAFIILLWVSIRGA